MTTYLLWYLHAPATAPYQELVCSSVWYTCLSTEDMKVLQSTLQKHASFKFQLQFLL